MKIKISKDISLPLDLVTQSVAILAKRRVGKSYCARKISGAIFAAGQQICIIDPKGDWWGIRYAQDGKGPGLPVIILGGEHGDVPLDVNSGLTVATLLVEEHVSILLDLSLMRKREVSQFMTQFLENLYRFKAQNQYRTPLMLMIDEADAIAPQRPQPEEARMLGAIEDIVRRGGQRGIGCTMVTQRSAVLNKNVLTQVQMLVCLRTIAPQDLKAMNEWIDVHGTQEERKMLMDTLPSLPVGDAWFWSPGWPTETGIFLRTHIDPIDTFDSGATPKPGEKAVKPRGIAEINIDVLKRQMSDVIEKAKADDPKELKKKIAELEKQLSTKPKVETQPKVKEINVVNEKDLIKWEALLNKMDKVLDKQHEINLSFGLAMNGIKDSLQKAIQSVAKPSLPKSTTAITKFETIHAGRKVESLFQNIAAINRVKDKELLSEDKLPIGEEKILSALIQYPQGLKRNQLTVLCGYKQSARDTYISRLAQRGYVGIGKGSVVATEAGQKALPNFEPLPSGQELQKYHLERIPLGEAKILKCLIDAYPNALTRAELGDLTGYKQSARDTYISRMTSREIIVISGPGEVKASENLF